jgi:hypothetical protein
MATDVNNEIVAISSPSEVNEKESIDLLIHVFTQLYHNSGNSAWITEILAGWNCKTV